MFSFKKNEYLKNILTLVTGNSLAQIVSIALTPIITRLYTPEEFGFFGLFFSIVGGLSVLISARYELAIVLPADEEKAVHLTFLSSIICITLSIVFFIVILLLYIFKNSISPWLLLMPVFTILIGFYQILNNWNNRKKNYRTIAFNRITNSATTNSLTLLLGYLKVSAPGLIIGNLAGQIVSVVILIKKDFEFLKQRIKNTNLKKLKQVAVEYKDMPKFNSFQSIIDAFQLNGMTYLIPIFYNATTLGLYSFCMRIMQAPVNLVGSAISQVFFQKAAELYNSGGNIKKLVTETMLKSALLFAPVPLIMIPFGPTLFAFIFGEQWREAGVYASYLAPYLYLDFIRLTVSQLPIVIGLQKKMTYLSFIGNIILLASILYSGLIAHSLKNGVLIYSILSSVLIIFILLWIYKKSKMVALK